MITTTTAPLTLWLTDRSRYVNGTGRCKRLRYLTNHSGPTGYGIVRKGQSLPLATGKFTHAALETLAAHLVQHDTFPTVAIIRDAIATACHAYEAEIEAKGFRGLLASERTEYVVREQITWLEGAVWAACRTVLPWIWTNYRVVESEVESLYVMDCTCGLGSAILDGQAHSERGCGGIAQMLRQDLICVHRQTGRGAYMEFKTTGWMGDSWSSQWETRPQLPIGTFGVQERLGIDLAETFVIGLYKGRRAKFQHPVFGEIYRQESPFTYGYCRPGNPPLATDDWVPSYEWKDAEGQTKRATRQHQKRGIWELAESDWDLWLASKEADPSLTPVEFWTSWLPESTVAGQVFLIGPMKPRAEQVASLKRQIVGEERHWQTILWDLYEKQKEGFGWSSPEFQAELDRLVPASWDCRRYGAGHECEMLDLCWRQEGWEDPLATGKWQARRPHHAPELVQAVARGLLPEEAGDEPEAED